MAAKKAKSNSKKRGSKSSSSSTKRVVSTSSKPAKPVAKATKTPPQKEQSSVELPFSRKNYILLLIGVGLIAFGFILMSMDDFVDASEFSISLYIAPPIVVAGFLEIIYAIMYKDKTTPASDKNPT